MDAEAAAPYFRAAMRRPAMTVQQLSPNLPLRHAVVVWTTGPKLR
jgi:hypothetical protein